MAPIKDTFTTVSSVNPVRYPDVYKMLLAYPKGYPMVVPYYHRQDPSIDMRSFVVSISMDEDKIHEDLTKIHNLEMKLEEPLSFQMQEEDKSTQLNGSAIMYPGLEPFEGDIFFMEVDNKQSVCMIVNQVEPTTFRQERYYRIRFSAYSQLTKQLLDRIESVVTEEVHFERRKYFGESQMTFLSTDSYKQLKELEHYRKCLTQDLINFFFNRDSEAFWRPDEVYDPYLSEYLRNKLTVQRDRVRPRQLLVPLQNFHKTIWYKFVLAENCSDLSDVARYGLKMYKDPKLFTSDYNSLTGHYYIEVSDTNTGTLYPCVGAGATSTGVVNAMNGGCSCSPKDRRYPHLLKDACADRAHHPDRKLGYSYHECPICSANDGCGATDDENSWTLFSESFYTGRLDSGADPLEEMIFRYLTENKKVNIEKLLEMVRVYRKLGRTTLALYRMSLYLELVDAAILSIR